jgi:hypothetical protein
MTLEHDLHITLDAENHKLCFEFEMTAQRLRVEGRGIRRLGMVGCKPPYRGPGRDGGQLPDREQGSDIWKALTGIGNE